MKGTRVRVILPEGTHEVEFEKDLREVVFRPVNQEEPHTLRFHEIQPGVYRVELGDRQEIVLLEPGPDQVVVQTRYRRYLLRVERAGARAATGLREGEVTVRAPMSGLVVDVLKEAGETVKEGEALLILEAMKMRSEIPAPAPGVIKRIHVEPGQSVSAGRDLVVLQVSNSGV